MNTVRPIAVGAIALIEFACLWRCQQYGASPFISDVVPFGGWPWMTADKSNWIVWSGNLVASTLVATATGHGVRRLLGRPSQITIRSVLMLMTLAAAACARARIEPDWPDLLWEDAGWRLRRTFFFPTAPFAPWPLRAAVLIGLVSSVYSVSIIIRSHVIYLPGMPRKTHGDTTRRPHKTKESAI